MVASWGGYVFIINIIPLFVLGCIFINKLTIKIYIAYNIFYTFMARWDLRKHTQHKNMSSHFFLLSLHIFIFIFHFSNKRIIFYSYHDCIILIQVRISIHLFRQWITTNLHSQTGRLKVPSEQGNYMPVLIFLLRLVLSGYCNKISWNIAL
jgi:hypothetical protein